MCQSTGVKVWTAAALPPQYHLVLHRWTRRTFNEMRRIAETEKARIRRSRTKRKRKSWRKTSQWLRKTSAKVNQRNISVNETEIKKCCCVINRRLVVTNLKINKLFLSQWPSGYSSLKQKWKSKPKVNTTLFHMISSKNTKVQESIKIQF